MKVALKKDLYISKLGVVFPKDISTDVITYKSIKMLVHPLNKGILTNLPKHNYTILK
jgi:hypothetical protein